MTVFLLKNRSNDNGLPDPYEETIKDSVFVPIMDYHSVDQLGLEQALAAGAYDGIIVTSQRAVDAIRSVLGGLPEVVLEKPVYTVGPTTAKRLEGLNFKHVKGADSGNGQALAERMVSDLPGGSRLLFLAGEIHRRELPDRLVGSGNEVVTRIVYRTTKNPDISGYLEENARPGDWIVFFSPSHTESVLSYLNSSGTELRIAAIGPTTERFLESSGFRPEAVAKTPSADGLKTAIESSHKGIERIV